MTKARQAAILSSAAASTLASSVAALLKERGTSIPHLEVAAQLPSSLQFRPDELVISSDRYLDDNSAGVVIFTSGTTGRPKGSVLRRAYIHETALAVSRFLVAHRLI